MPDDFIREARHLREWLPELLGPEPAVRRRAENAISAMKWGAPVADATAFRHRPKDFNAHSKDWAMTITRAINRPEFDGVKFILTAIERMRADWQLSHEKSNLKMLLFDDPGIEETKRIAKRMNELKIEETGRLPNSSGAYTLHQVIEHAGPILLKMADPVRGALRDAAVSSTFAAALRNLGTAAHEFAFDLMTGTDHYSKEPTIPYPQALVAVARNDPRALSAIRELALSGSERQSLSAAYILADIGPSVIEFLPTLVDDLLALSDARMKRKAGHRLLLELAKLAPDRADIFQRAADSARPAPPQMQPIEGHPEYQFDTVMYTRGPALEALGHMPAFAAQAIPILVDAMTTFEEYDPDWGYHLGNHGRVVDALVRLAPAAPDITASLAAPAMARQIRGSDGEIDHWIIKSLGKLGPLAVSAAPVLRQLWEKDLTGVFAKELPDESDDPIRWAMLRVEGKL